MPFTTGYRCCGISDSLAWNKRERERKRPGAVGPCEVGVAGPEANPAHSGSEAPGRLWGASMEWSAPLHSDGLGGQNDGVSSSFDNGAEPWTR